MKKVLFFAAMLGLAVACAETKKVEENNAEETVAVEVVEEAVEAPAEAVVEAPAEVVVEEAAEEAPELPSIKTDIKVDTKVEANNDRKPITEAPKTRVEKKPSKEVPLKPAATIKE